MHGLILSQVPDGNGGQPLPNNPLFGELVAGLLIKPPPLEALAPASKNEAGQEIANKKLLPLGGYGGRDLTGRLPLVGAGLFCVSAWHVGAPAAVSDSDPRRYPILGLWSPSNAAQRRKVRG